MATLATLRRVAPSPNDRMDFSAPTLWWILAGLLVAVELATGTFYLLMLATGAVAGALAAHAGLPPSAEIVAAAIVGGGTAAGGRG